MAVYYRILIQKNVTNRDRKTFSASSGFTMAKLTTTLSLPGLAELSDDRLVEMTLQGDDQAFENLVGRYSRRVFAIARHFFRQPETVEDIAQETFTKAYFALQSYQRGASLEYWLARIAVNNCYDELRRRKSRGELTVSDMTEDEVNWMDNKLAQVSVNRHIQIGERQIASEVTQKLLDKLSAEDRTILILLHAEEYSVAEIAKLIGWSEAKVKIRAFRARHAMRKLLQRLQLIEQRKDRQTAASLAA
jgi:RNA polymerase sigma-70 factor, ECF subfamily